MLAIVTSEGMRDAERRASVDEADLMLRAARGIAEAVTDRFLGATSKTVLGLVGPGNNGGDTLCSLALLADDGWTALALPILRGEAGELPVETQSLNRVEWVADLDRLREADVILDGIFGNGARHELPDDVRSVTRAVNELRSEHAVPILAIDVPTGCDSDTGEADDSAIRADVTLAIGLPKLGLLKEPAASRVGDLDVLDIGVPVPEGHAGPWMADAQMVRKLLPQRAASAHKHTLGGVLIIGGAPHYYGAPRLSGSSALRAGAGYVGMAVPRSIVSSIATAVPELVYHPLSDGDGRRSAQQIHTALEETGTRYRAVVIGPGLGRDEVAKQLLDTLLSEHNDTRPTDTSGEVGFGIPRRASLQQAGASFHRVFTDRAVVVDADALYWLSQQEDWAARLRDLDCVLTPHAGELARLLGVDVDEVLARPAELATQAARMSGQVVVLKYGYTCVCAPDGRVVHAPRSTPELATPGTGDALSGLIAAFLALDLDPMDASVAAVYVGAMAGRHARSSLGTYSVVASDLIESIPSTLQALTEPEWSRKDVITWSQTYR